MTNLEPPAAACLERTRSHVLNVLVGVGIGIAASGFLLRGRAEPPLVNPALRTGLFAGLMAVVVASRLAGRVLGARSALADPGGRAARFHRAHVVSAAIGALAIPLGLVYGWMIRPRLDEVLPFWVAALALGFLALPRASALEGFDSPMPEPDEPRA